MCIIMCYVIGERAQQASLGTWSLNCAVFYISIILCVQVFLIGTDTANVPVCRSHLGSSKGVFCPSELPYVV